MSSVGGYTSPSYERLENLAERLDWMGREHPDYDATMAAYLQALSTVAAIRGRSDRQPRRQETAERYPARRNQPRKLSKRALQRKQAAARRRRKKVSA
ncbi:hypothetical protein [Nocardia farcinica]|uniref:hypothetical protein n=1 Tax=Nocardia farcinica TaxID=37329 RepID=UPI0024557546|nr:hypothetical protein [Nocardia farcinica]